MINVEGLTKYYDDFCAVDHISFEIKKGEILGLLGPNGAGKTTTLRMLTCYFPPTEGTIKVKDMDIRKDSLDIKNCIGYLPESAPLYQDMLVYDYLEYVAGIRGITPEKTEARLQELADICGLREIMHRSVHELSKGLKQRVGLAHALMSDPEIMVLDEPTSGLDPNQIVEIRELIKRIGREKTVILSSHILSEVEATCDRVVIINKGKIVADGTMEDLKKSGQSDYSISLTLSGASFKDLEKELKKLGGIVKVEESESSKGNTSATIYSNSAEDIRPSIYKTIKNKDWILLEFRQEKKTLEELFRELTKEN